MNILDFHLPRLLQQALDFEQSLPQLARPAAEAGLRRLESYWGSLQDVAARQGVYLGDYDAQLQALFHSLARSRAHIEVRAARRTMWAAVLGLAVGLVNKVLGWLHLPKIGRPLLAGAQRLFLAAG